MGRDTDKYRMSQRPNINRCANISCKHSTDFNTCKTFWEISLYWSPQESLMLGLLSIRVPHSEQEIPLLWSVSELILKCFNGLKIWKSPAIKRQGEPSIQKKRKTIIHIFEYFIQHSDFWRIWTAHLHLQLPCWQQCGVFASSLHQQTICRSETCQQNKWIKHTLGNKLKNNLKCILNLEDVSSLDRIRNTTGESFLCVCQTLFGYESSSKRDRWVFLVMWCVCFKATVLHTGNWNVLLRQVITNNWVWKLLCVVVSV